MFSRTLKRRLGIELLQQRWAAVKTLPECLERLPIVQCVECRLVRKLPRNVLRKRSGNVRVRDRVVHKRRYVPPCRCKLLPRLIVDLAGRRQLMRALERSERALQVEPGAAIDLARRETAAIKRYLRC